MTFLASLWQAYNADKIPRLASSVAFAAIFSIAPLFVILIAIAGYVIGIQDGGHGHHVAEDALLGPIRSGAGAGAADAVRGLVLASFNKPRQDLIAQIVGWVTFAAGAAGLFAALQDALNVVWNVAGPANGWRRLLRDRLASFAMILVVGVLLLATVAANAGAAILRAQTSGPFAHPGEAAALTVAAQGVSLALVAVGFALIYKVLPDAPIGWRDAWIGAAVTAVLFVLGEAAIGWYLAFAGVASAYGAAGSLLAGLLWIYYSATILLVGAEVTKLIAAHSGRPPGSP